MVRAQDGGIPCQVLKVVHDDCHKQVEHLNQRGKGREKGKEGERRSREGKGERRKKKLGHSAGCSQEPSPGREMVCDAEVRHSTANRVGRAQGGRHRPHHPQGQEKQQRSKGKKRRKCDCGQVMEDDLMSGVLARGIPRALRGGSSPGRSRRR